MSEEKRIPLHIYDDYDPELQRRWKEEQKLKEEAEAKKSTKKTSCSPFTIDLNINYDDFYIDDLYVDFNI